MLGRWFHRLFRNWNRRRYRVGIFVQGGSVGLLYSNSKVTVRAYGDALRPLLKKDGITVSTIFPGFVRTPE